MAATAVKVLIDTRSRLITYSNAGHPPPVLLHRDGTCELKATDPPLGAREHHAPRPQAGLSYGRGTPSSCTRTASSNVATKTSTPA